MQPQQATANPPQATANPQQATEKTEQNTDMPQQATEKPPHATANPPQATEMPTEKTQQNTEMPPQATEKPQQATEKPPQATEKTEQQAEMPPQNTDMPQQAEKTDAQKCDRLCVFVFARANIVAATGIDWVRLRPCDGVDTLFDLSVPGRWRAVYRQTEATEKCEERPLHNMAQIKAFLMEMYPSTFMNKRIAKCREICSFWGVDRVQGSVLWLRQISDDSVVSVTLNENLFASCGIVDILPKYSSSGNINDNNGDQENTTKKESKYFHRMDTDLVRILHALYTPSPRIKKAALLPTLIS